MRSSNIGEDKYKINQTMVNHRGTNNWIFRDLIYDAGKFYFFIMKINGATTVMY